MDIAKLAELHLQRRATEDQVAFLATNIEEWWRELVKILNRYLLTLQDIIEKQAKDAQKYEGDETLQAKAWEAWEAKRLKAARNLRRAEYDLAVIDQIRHVSNEEPPTQREKFLMAAIKAHRDFTKHEGFREADRNLYNALNGKWTFTDLPEELSWSE